MFSWAPKGMIALMSREVARTFRVPVQTLVGPWISAALYILVFGAVVGSQLSHISGVPYINFVIPGILMMSVLNAAFMAAAHGLYFQRFTKMIEEILVAPLSYTDMIFAFVLAAVVRGLVVAVGIYGMAILLGAAVIVHPVLFLVGIVGVSMLFAFLGLIVGLWSEGFEQLSVLQTFIIQPLTYLGGIFYARSMLPEWAQIFTTFNPFFQLVDTVRYTMVGVREGSALAGWGTMWGLTFFFGLVAWTLFQRGYKLRS